ASRTVRSVPPSLVRVPGVSLPKPNPSPLSITSLSGNLLDRFRHHGGVVMDNEPPPITPFVEEGIPRLQRLGGARRLAREEERIGSDIGRCVAPDPNCTGIDDAPRVALEEMDKIVLDCGGVGPGAI